MNELEYATRNALAKFYSKTSADPAPTVLDQVTGEVQQMRGDGSWRTILSPEGVKITDRRRVR
jgi:hypothetical protein